MSINELLLERREKHLDELKELLRIPSISTDDRFKPDVQRCAAWVEARLKEAGLTTRTYPTPRHPVVYGEWLGAPGAPTVLIYGHYDVQPSEPDELWRNPPFEPTIEGGNIVARGATDDKGQFYCHVKAIETLMAAQGSLPVNVKVLIEGEEEIGSPSLDPFIEQHRDMLAADVVLVSDTPMYAPGKPSITYGLRGLTYIEVTVEGASHDLHSGLYGGAVANPINALATIISRLKDESGRIQVPGFYDEVVDLDPEERNALLALEYNPSEFCASVGIEASTGEAGYAIIERVTTRPTLDCNGIWGGYTGQGAKTVLPAQAHAKISCRLVPNQTPEAITESLSNYLKAVAPAGVKVTVRANHGTIPFVVDRSAPAMKAAMVALEQTWGVKPVYTRGGGSIPVVASFKRLLGLDTILMGFGLEDDRLHSPNEKFALENYFQGIRASVLFLEQLALTER
jgi:acetylornithine deacetylase/succinyl-diaminopimelate desuccinylase-like protein